MKITVETAVKAPLEAVWSAWSDPDQIKRWNAPTDEWHTTRSSVDLREGGRFHSRMEAKDGSAGFDFEGTEDVVVKETFDAETESTLALQRLGWQAILDNFGQHVEARFKGANGLADKM